jgi:hypothetical protein
MILINQFESLIANMKMTFLLTDWIFVKVDFSIIFQCFILTLTLSTIDQYILKNRCFSE